MQTSIDNLKSDDKQDLNIVCCTGLQNKCELNCIVGKFDRQYIKIKWSKWTSSIIEQNIMSLKDDIFVSFPVSRINTLNKSYLRNEGVILAHIIM